MRVAAMALVVELAGEAHAHDWYTNRENPVTHRSCCGLADCSKIDSRLVTRQPDGDYVVSGRRLWRIPRNQVQSSPDSDYHLCETVLHEYDEEIGEYSVFAWTCFFAPSEAAMSPAPSERL